jgi:hypothetical protein
MRPRQRKKTPEEFVEGLISDEPFRRRLSADPAALCVVQPAFPLVLAPEADGAD